MDLAPYYANAEYIHKVHLINDYDHIKPKTKKTTDVHPYLMVQPEKVDFRRQVKILSCLTYF